MSNKNVFDSNSEEVRRLAAIFQHSKDGIITISREGIVESVNPSAARLFGYTPTEVIDKNIKMLMPEPYHSAHDGYIGNYHNTGKKKIIGIGREVQGKRKDNTVFPFFLNVSEVQLEGRKIFTGFIHDISALKEQEMQLEESRSRLKAIFETAVDGIVIINDKGIVQSINPAVSRLFGYAKEEVVGNNVKMLMPEPRRSEHDQYIRNYRETGKAKIIGIGREVEGKRKDGSLFSFNLGISEVKIKDEVIYTGIINDLTLYKKKEREIQELNQLLEQKVVNRTNELSKTVNKLLATNKKMEFEINERKKVETALRQSELEILHALDKEKELGELKSRFVSMASHEFRTPLSTILSSVSLIGRYTETDQQDKRDKHIERIKSAVKNLTGILNDFLSLSKLEEGKIQNKPEIFDLNGFCREVIEELEGLLKKGQEIHFHKPKEDRQVLLDKRLLKNIVFNLMSNAIKYSPEDKPIYCMSAIDNNQLEIKIKDEGMGIPEEEQVHLFSRFFRAHNVSNIQGTGLGLNIVKSYVKLLNGSITFESTEGVGTTFSVYLPLTPLS
ncbi:MAG: two-component system sensor kinase FixL [Saprospiraceae bacterium]